MPNNAVYRSAIGVAPAGMARALIAMALAQALVTAIALLAVSARTG